MTAIVVAEKIVTLNEQLKTVYIQTSAAADSSHTYDTNLDVADGRGAEFTKIIDAYHVGVTGTRVDASWAEATGIVTLGTVSGGAVAVRLVILGY